VKNISAGERARMADAMQLNMYNAKKEQEKSGKNLD
jgi:hypothetical protein